jgi:transcriptional regulator with XRE-family HTH domain
MGPPDLADEVISGADFPAPGNEAHPRSRMWWRREKKEVSEFLYRVLVGEAPRGFARKVAERMGVPYSTLAKYWLGKRRFPASLVKPLFLAAGEDPRIAEFFVLEGSSYRLERREDDETLDDVLRALLELSALEGKLGELYLRATSPDSEDGEQLSRVEAEELRGAAERLILQAQRLRAAFHPGGDRSGSGS